MQKTILFIALILIAFSSCKEDKVKTPSSTAVVPSAVKVNMPAFSKDSAYSFVAKQVAFGPRVPGTPEHLECRDWLVSKLKAYGATTQIQGFKSGFFGKIGIESYNIIASFNPKAFERILLVAHWDTRLKGDKDEDETKRDQPILGADDGASGVGVLLELARIIGQSDLKLGVDIVLFDAEDQGDDSNDWCQGSNYWSNFPHKPGYMARFGILLDMVGAKGAMFGKEGYSQANAKNILDKVWKVAHDLGYTELFSTLNTGPVQDDHYFVMLNRRIPTIDIINRPLRTDHGFGTYHHTHNDNLDIIDPNTLEKVGNVVAKVLTLEAQL